MSAKTTTRSIRKTLAEAIERVVKGELDAQDGKNLIGLSNQISKNMDCEVKVLKLKHQLGHKLSKFGDLEVG